MSYNYWLFYQDDWAADAANVPAPVGVPLAPLSHGPGNPHKYDLAPLSYWQVREDFLRSAPVQPNGIPLIRPQPQRRINMPPPPPPPVRRMRRDFTEDERAPMLAAMKGAQSLAELKNLSAAIKRGTTA
jgi:hypothetical protein